VWIPRIFGQTLVESILKGTLGGLVLAELLELGVFELEAFELGVIGT
jgi:hypothetical protein